MGTVSLEDYMRKGISLDRAYEELDMTLGKFFVTMLGSEELPEIKKSVKSRLLQLVDKYARGE